MLQKWISPTNHSSCDGHFKEPTHSCIGHDEFLIPLFATEPLMSSVLSANGNEEGLLEGPVTEAHLLNILFLSLPLGNFFVE